MSDPYRSFLYGDSEKDIAHYGGPPSYDVVNEFYEKGRTQAWKEGSLERIVDNLVKTWEMELSHKSRTKDHKTIDCSKLTISVNAAFRNNRARYQYPQKIGHRRSDMYKDSAKRKRLDDSRRPEEEMELDDNDHQGEDKEDTNTLKVGLNGSVDEENELTGSHIEQELGSQTMEVSIQHIQQKMDLFTQQVSGLLEAGKSFFIDAATAFEERVVQLHRNQIEKWEHEMELLRAMDAVNEDLSFRLADARAAINFLRPGPLAPASS